MNVIRVVVWNKDGEYSRDHPWSATYKLHDYLPPDEAARLIGYGLMYAGDWANDPNDHVTVTLNGRVVHSD